MVPRLAVQCSSWGLAPSLLPPAAAPVAVFLPPLRVGVVALQPPMASSMAKAPAETEGARMDFQRGAFRAMKVLRRHCLMGWRPWGALHYFPILGVVNPMPGGLRVCAGARSIR